MNGCHESFLFLLYCEGKWLDIFLLSFCATVLSYIELEHSHHFKRLRNFQGNATQRDRQPVFIETKESNNFASLLFAKQLDTIIYLSSA
jgi:hypothetical protein